MQKMRSILRDEQVSISSTLYARVFRTNFLPKQNVTRHVTREKLPKRHSYEKFVRLTLMKLTTGLNALFTETEEDRKLDRHSFIAGVARLFF